MGCQMEKRLLAAFLIGLITGFCGGGLLVRVLYHNKITDIFNSCGIFQKIGTDNLVEIVECFNKNGA